MTPELPKNRFKVALAQGKTQIGLWSTLSCPTAAEVIGGAGFDWILFDTEHAPVDIPRMADILRAAAGSSHTAIRVPWNDIVMIKRALDIGAQTIFVPFVQSPEDAACVVRSCRYPPEGTRGVAGSTRASGYGRIKDYLPCANAEICVIVQIETKGALEQLEQIAAVPGVDGVFIGPSDLSASYGHLGQPDCAEMQVVLKDACDRLAAIGKPSGILAGTKEQALRFRDWGYKFVAAGVDTTILTRAIDDLRSALTD